MTAPPPPAPSAHRGEAEALIEAVQVLLGADFTAQDQAEAGALRSLADAVDADPSNVAGLRELRINLAGYRRQVFRPNPTEQTELAELIAQIQGTHLARPTLYDEVFSAAVTAGASPEAAQAAAEAATAPYRAN